MLMRFDDAKHWVPVYRERFQGDVPPLQWRICTKFKSENAEVPTDIPSSAMYPAGFIWKLLASPRGIRFTVVAPGIIDTDRSGFVKTHAGLEYASSVQLLERVGEPSDVADAVAFRERTALVPASKAGNFNHHD